MQDYAGENSDVDSNTKMEGRRHDMPFYEKGDVRIRYQEAGSGFPLLITPGGGLNSRISNNWTTAVFNAMEIFSDDFRCITMDQRNAIGGESTGPVPVDDPWNAFADDQLGLLDHLGVKQFVFLGFCIGACYALKLMERAPKRIVGAVICQAAGHWDEDPDVIYRYSQETWVKEIMPKRPDVTSAVVDKYLHNLFRARPDFVYSVSREFARSCETPTLVVPDNTDAHPYQLSVDLASLMPNADFTVYPWRDPPELKERTINRVRKFLRDHRPAAAK